MPHRVLVINPNTTKSMTEALRPFVESLAFIDTTYTYFTGREGPLSINNDYDEEESTRLNWPHIEPLIPHFDGFIVACYSRHGLVPLIRAHAQGKPVAGIFEASITACLHLLQPRERFGIVSTGSAWEALLADAVRNFLGASDSAKFAGVETTGVNAIDLHGMPPEIICARMKEATRKLVGKGNVGAVCLGCAGMAGMNEMIREASIEQLGKEKGDMVKVVDGVKAAVWTVEGLMRTQS